MQEATCEEGAEAEVIVIFDVGDWVGFEMADGFGCRNTNGGGGGGGVGWGCFGFRVRASVQKHFLLFV